VTLKFLDLDAYNFGTFRKLENFALSGRGLVLILGDNQDTPRADSNGAGKSLLLDAFCWAIWGKTIRDMSHDEVINEKAGKNCKVVVRFKKGDVEYTVKRYRGHDLGDDDTENAKPNDLVLLADGAAVTGGKMTDTQKDIDALLGLNFDVFQAMMPGTGLKAAKLGDAGIKELLEAILQTSVLSEAGKIGKRRLEAAERELELLSVEVEDTLAHSDFVMEQAKKVRSLHASYAVDKANKIAELDKSSNLKFAEYERAQKEWAALDSKLGPLRLEVAQLPQAVEDMDAAKNKALELKQEHYEASSTYKRQLSNMRNSKAKIEESIERIDALGAQCDECFQVVDEDKKKHTRGTLVEAAAIARRDIVAFGEEMTAAATLFSQTERETDDKAQQLADLVRSLRDKEREAMTVSASMIPVDARMRALIQEVDDLHLEADRLEHEESPYQELVDNNQKELEKAEANLVGLRERTGQLEQLIQDLSFWKHAFSSQGIRSYMLKNVTPVINEITRKNCDLLTEGEMGIIFNTQSTLSSGETREKFNIQVSQKHGGSTYSRNSEGERQRADIVVAFSLADLAAMRSAFPFRFLDEPFVKMDESGTDAVIPLLRKYESEYDTIFVVTHRDHVKSMFQNTITVVKKDGVSTIEEAVDA
jgi:DNA repair exonuclease SbcCD ATPase subunit